MQLDTAARSMTPPPRRRWRRGLVTVLGPPAAAPTPPRTTTRPWCSPTRRSPSRRAGEWHAALRRPAVLSTTSCRHRRPRPRTSTTTARTSPTRPPARRHRPPRRRGPRRRPPPGRDRADLAAVDGDRRPGRRHRRPSTSFRLAAALARSTTTSVDVRIPIGARRRLDAAPRPGSTRSPSRSSSTATSSPSTTRSSSACRDGRRDDAPMSVAIVAAAADPGPGGDPAAERAGPPRGSPTIAALGAAVDGPIHWPSRPSLVAASPPTTRARTPRRARRSAVTRCWRCPPTCSTRRRPWPSTRARRSARELLRGEDILDDGPARRRARASAWLGPGRDQHRRGDDAAQPRLPLARPRPRDLRRPRRQHRRVPRHDAGHRRRPRRRRAVPGDGRRPAGALLDPATPAGDGLSPTDAAVRARRRAGDDATRARRRPRAAASSCAADGGVPDPRRRASWPRSSTDCPTSRWRRCRRCRAPPTRWSSATSPQVVTLPDRPGPTSADARRAHRADAGRRP